MTRAIGYELTPITVTPEDSASTLAAAAARRGLDLARTYADAGVERTTAPALRPGLANAIGVMRPGDALFVSSRSDLAPDAVQAGMVERLVANRGGTVVAADQPTMDPLVQAMSAAFAEYEAFVAAAATRADPDAQQHQPRPTVLPPASLHRGRGVRARAEATSSRATIGQDPAALAVIRGHLHAGWSAADIADELNRRGCESIDGEPWRADQVRRLIEARQLARLQPEPEFRRASARATAPSGPRASRVDALVSIRR